MFQLDPDQGVIIEDEVFIGLGVLFIKIATRRGDSQGRKTDILENIGRTHMQYLNSI
jgi:hypothetical protein